MLFYIMEFGILFSGVEDTFYVDKNTGIVKLMRKLDYESKNMYTMTVRARDNGTVSLRTSCQLIVSLKNRRKTVILGICRSRPSSIWGC